MGHNKIKPVGGTIKGMVNALQRGIVSGPIGKPSKSRGSLKVKV